MAKRDVVNVLYPIYLLQTLVGAAPFVVRGPKGNRLFTKASPLYRLTSYAFCALAAVLAGYAITEAGSLKNTNVIVYLIVVCELFFSVAVMAAIVFCNGLKEDALTKLWKEIMEVDEQLLLLDLKPNNLQPAISIPLAILLNLNIAVLAYFSQSNFGYVTTFLSNLIVFLNTVYRTALGLGVRGLLFYMRVRFEALNAAFDQRGAKGSKARETEVETGGANQQRRGRSRAEALGGAEVGRGGGTDRATPSNQALAGMEKGEGGPRGGTDSEVRGGSGRGAAAPPTQTVLGFDLAEFGEGAIYAAKVVELHLRSCDIVRSITEIYRAPLLANMFADFSLLIVQLYYYLSSAYKSQEYSARHVVLSVVYTCLIVADVTAFIAVSARISEEANLMKKRMLRVSAGLGFMTPFYKQFNGLFLNYLHNDVKVTAGGFFTVDYELAFKMIAAGSSYLIILIQFDLFQANNSKH